MRRYRLSAISYQTFGLPGLRPGFELVAREAPNVVEQPRGPMGLFRFPIADSWAIAFQDKTTRQ
jgi:hypothetical protein